jgi:hypothetical protein
VYTYDGLVLNTIGLGPARHDVRVVVCEANNLVDTLGLELRELGKVTRDVGGGAGRGESTRQSKDDNLLVLKLCCIGKRKTRLATTTQLRKTKL